MQNGDLARSTQRLIQMLRPENVGTAAQTAMTWFKPLPAPPGVKNIQSFPDFPASLGRLGALEVRLEPGHRRLRRGDDLVQAVAGPAWRKEYPKLPGFSRFPWPARRARGTACRRKARGEARAK